VDIPAFRKAFPEFSDESAYPTAQVQFWVTVAEAQLPQNIWCNLWTQGVNLYVAHEITLARQNAQAAEVGGTPGKQGGTPASKTVGSMTVAYDSATISEKDAGYWNLTSYGKQLYRLIKIFGARPIQL
jgi:hypothetical protein